jgi:alpha-tubulin suppressor-like RCC1 family protein
VEYFAKRNIKIYDVVLGEYHSVALTEDGDVYTWGYAGKGGALYRWYYHDIGALGHGDVKH